MSIYINKNNRQTGPFDEQKVLEMLGRGELSPDDWAIRQGDAKWQSLKEMFPAAATMQNAGSSMVQEAPTPVATAPEARKGLSKMRLLLGVLFILSFLGFHLMIILMAYSYGSYAKIPVPSGILFGGAFFCLFLCAILIILLAIGVGAKNGMSRWRTPLLCVLVLLWCFGVGAFTVYSRSSSVSDEQLKSSMKKLDLKESDLLYQDIMAGIERNNRVEQGAYGLLGLGALCALCAVVSIVVAGRKNKSAA